MIRAVSILLAVCAAASAYTRGTTEAGIALWRQDAANIRFLVHTSMKPGATSDDGGIAITQSSNPAAALAAAGAAWSAVGDSTVRFAPLEETTLLNSSRDRQHVILIADTPETRSIVGSALAITMCTYSVADGAVTDTDILFNPRVMENGRQVAFSTDHASGTYDLQSVATHEFGHALGASHSCVISAAMFQTTTAFSQFVSVAEATMQAVLAPDDIAFLLAAYPAPGAAARYGRISGTVRYEGGGGVRVPLVIATDPAAGVVIGIAGSPANGTYSIEGVPPGKYHVYAQPLDGPVLPGYLGTAGSTQAEMFRTTFAGGNQTPALIEVTAGAAETADIVVDPAAPGMHVNQVGVGSAGGNDWSFAATRAIAAGRTWDILLWGRGLDANVRREQILLLGPGLTVREGSLREQRTAMVNGFAALRFTVEVAARASRAQVPIAVLKDGDGAANTASLVLLPGGTPPAPVFSEAAVANAASGAPGMVPAGLVRISGRNLAPFADGSVTSAGIARLSGVSVAIDGAEALLVSVASSAGAESIVFQAPPSLAAGGRATVEVRNNGSSLAVPGIAVLAAQPGLFERDGLAVATRAGGSRVDALAPAKPGETISIYLTGAGTSPGPTAVLLGEAVCAVENSGPSPDLGVWSIAFTLPDGVPRGAAKLTVRMGEAAANASVLPVE